MPNPSLIFSSVSLALFASTTATAFSPQLDVSPSHPSVSLSKRASPEAPNGYAPQAGACPSELPTIRDAASLSSNETEWTRNRREQTIAPMRSLLARLNITGLDTNAYIDRYASSNISQLPNIALAFSGGGYRALMNGAGAVAALDDRTRHNSTAAGSLAGLMQASTYMSGLSGGSWLVSSLFSNNFTSVQQILDANPNNGNLWQFGNSIFDGPDAGSISILDTAGYYKTIASEVQSKRDAGFDASITDYWGRALSYQLVNATSGGPAYTFSSIADADWFRNASVPLPLVVANGRSPGQIIVGGNSTVYEFSPWEMGSWDPTTYAFAPIRYSGTNFTAGKVADSNACVRGYDNVGMVFGTSSTLFNQFLLQINDITSVPEVLRTGLSNVLQGLNQSDNDIATWPNVFRGFNNATSRITNEEYLDLVDGGEDGQNIPLYPLTQPVREVDVIFAVDSSADTPDGTPAPFWPNGTSLIATYERSALDIANGTVFPSIPDAQTFVNLGLNNRPTFFGCNTTNLTAPAPLIIYVPNAPYSYNTNVSTFQPTTNNTERNAIINNGYNVATMGNGTIDSSWATCVGCAVLARSLERTGTEAPDVCRRCFERFCWDGRINSTVAAYVPEMKLAAINVAASGAARAVGDVIAVRALGVTVLAVLVAGLV